MTGKGPLARTDRLLTERVDGELLVYDLDGDVAVHLNETAALVWRSCDGSRTVAELATLVAHERGEAPDEDVVLMALDNLSEHGLIRSGYDERDGAAVALSRRRFFRRAGVIGVRAPVVYSLIVPTAAAALSTGGGGGGGGGGGIINSPSQFNTPSSIRVRFGGVRIVGVRLVGVRIVGIRLVGLWLWLRRRLRQRQLPVGQQEDGMGQPSNRTIVGVAILLFTAVLMGVGIHHLVNTGTCSSTGYAANYGPVPYCPSGTGWWMAFLFIGIIGGIVGGALAGGSTVGSDQRHHLHGDRGRLVHRGLRQARVEQDVRRRVRRLLRRRWRHHPDVRDRLGTSLGDRIVPQTARWASDWIDARQPDVGVWDTPDGGRWRLGRLGLRDGEQGRRSDHGRVRGGCKRGR